jgi:hypothetical protein
MVHRKTKLNKSGAVELPVKLMAVVLIVAVSVPLLTGAIERGESNNDSLVLNSETDKLFNTVATVHYSGIESSRTVSLHIPDNCEIVIPGGGGYAVNILFKGKQIDTRYMDKPPVRLITDGITISGSCLLLITGDIISGQSAVRVTVI